VEGHACSKDRRNAPLSKIGTLSLNGGAGECLSRGKYSETGKKQRRIGLLTHGKEEGNVHPEFLTSGGVEKIV